MAVLRPKFVQQKRIRKGLFFFVLLLLVLLGALVSLIFFLSQVKEVSSQSVSGFLFGNQRWSGEMMLTGDTMILGSLTLEPGTTLRFLVGDDRKQGSEIRADGFNDADPTRLATYAKSHVELIVIGVLTAVGTAEKPIVITSASEQPRLADWQGLAFTGNGSRIEQVVMEWSRNGLNPIGSHTKSVIRDSIFRHHFWAGISAGRSSITIQRNSISDCGHEGIDIQPGSSMATIEDNLITDCHTGIVILGGQPIVRRNRIRNVGDGIHVSPSAHPILADNEIILAPETQRHRWYYGDFYYELWR